MKERLRTDQNTPSMWSCPPRANTKTNYETRQKNRNRNSALISQTLSLWSSLQKPKKKTQHLDPKNKQTLLLTDIRQTPSMWCQLKKPLKTKFWITLLLANKSKSKQKWSQNLENIRAIDRQKKSHTVRSIWNQPTKKFFFSSFQLFLFCWNNHHSSRPSIRVFIKFFIFFIKIYSPHNTKFTNLLIPQMTWHENS